MKHLLLILSLSLSCVCVALAQKETPITSAQLEVTVFDRESGQPLPGAYLRLEQNKSFSLGATDASGKFAFSRLGLGNYQLKVSFVGYEQEVRRVHITGQTQAIIVKLKSSNDQLQEVVVTAKSSKGMTSSSLIGKEAMNHLQPSSIGDIMELLPGGFSSNPQLTSPDIIRLREATLPIVGRHNMLPRVNQSNYNTSSMGTSFLIDGVPVKMDAGLNGIYDTQNYGTRVPVNAGVDMRSISTEEVEHVEVVRGIPSVEYSDLTSGLVKVKRKQWPDELSGRFKSDLNSKLFFLSKGLPLFQDKMNIVGSVGYLTAYTDPRSVRDGYERITSSLRLVGKWDMRGGLLETLSSIDFTGTIDDRKRDKDMDVTPDDTYKASYNMLSFAQHLNYKPKVSTWLSDLELVLSASQTWDQTNITKDILMSRDVPYLTTKEEGEYEARYFPKQYVAYHTVDSRPLYLYAKLKGSSLIETTWSKHQVKWGSNWSYSKNTGRGAIFDLEKPLFWLASTRPRPFYDVPARSVLSLFIEDEMTLPVGAHYFTLMGGVVAQQLLGLDRSYKMGGKWYADLRLNARWSFAPITIKDRPLTIQLLAGVGSLSMFPSMEQLYPETIYDDFVELNYYHSNPDYRLVYMRSYIYHPDSKALVPAKNTKLEVRADLDYAGYTASFTYFQERMANGFRKDAELKIADFRYYDPQSVPHQTLTAKPSIKDFKYTDAREFRLLGCDTNGSETQKMGLEWMISTPRYPLLNMRVTFSGAWFRTIYRNSLPQYERPKAMIGGKNIPYIGRYNDNEILVRELLNSDLRLDTYIPQIRLGLSLSFQANWYSSSQKMPLSIHPDTYISLADGVAHDYTEEDKSNTYLQWLQRTYNESSFERYVVPFMMITNLKATKSLFHNKLRVALFVNKLFDYSPDIERNGYVIRRNQYPYFGMELVVTL